MEKKKEETKEKISLWEHLEIIGFKPLVVPITKTQEFLNKYYYRRAKYVPSENHDFLSHIIEGKRYEVSWLDHWYTNLRIDGEPIFDARRFEDKEFWKFLSLKQAGILSLRIWLTLN